MKNLHIPNPCSENWQTMSAQEQGKFCSVCNKCVIDFTEKQPQEIEYIFNERQNEGICGRFFSHQLNNKGEEYLSSKNKLFKYISTGFGNNKMALAIASMVLFLIGCSKPKEKLKSTASASTIEKDSIKPNDHFVMGEPLRPNDSVAQIPEKDHSKKEKKHVK